MKAKKFKTLKIILSIFLILFLISFFNVDVAATITTVLLLIVLPCWLCLLIFKKIKKKQIINDKKIEPKEIPQENNNKEEKEKTEEKNLFTDKNEVLEIYKDYTMVELDKEIEEIQSEIEWLESEIDITPDNTSLRLQEIKLSVLLNQLKNLKNKKQEQELEYIEVVGTKYTNAKSILRKIVRNNGEIWDVGGWQEHKINIQLIPDPKNPYDPNAIAVYPQYSQEKEERIGYIPKEIARVIRLKEVKNITAILKEGYGKFYLKIKKSDLM